MKLIIAVIFSRFVLSLGCNIPCLAQSFYSAPIITSPKADATIPLGKVQFTWTKSQWARSYKLQVKGPSQGENAVHEYETIELSKTAEDIKAPGSYTIKIAAVGAFGIGKFSTATVFHVQALGFNQNDASTSDHGNAPSDQPNGNQATDQANSKQPSGTGPSQPSKAPKPKPKPNLPKPTLPNPPSGNFWFAPVSGDWMTKKAEKFRLTVKGPPRPKATPICKLLDPEVDSDEPGQGFNIGAGGPCFFRCISHAITNDQQHHPLFRKLVCDHMEENQGRYLGKNPNPKEYIANMRKETTFATDLEVQVAANFLKIRIFAYVANTIFVPAGDKDDSLVQVDVGGRWAEIATDEDENPDEAIYVLNRLSHYNILYEWDVKKTSSK